MNYTFWGATMKNDTNKAKGKKKARDKEVRIGSIDDFKQAVKDVIADPSRLNDIAQDGVVFLDPELIPKILSKQRLRIIHEIRKRDYSVGELADKLHRKQEHVSRDIHLLEDYGFIYIVKDGKRSIPKTNDKICITV